MSENGELPPLTLILNVSDSRKIEEMYACLKQINEVVFVPSHTVSGTCGHGAGRGFPRHAQSQTFTPNPQPVRWINAAPK